MEEPCFLLGRIAVWLQALLSRVAPLPLHPCGLVKKIPQTKAFFFPFSLINVLACLPLLLIWVECRMKGEQMDFKHENEKKPDF